MLLKILPCPNFVAGGKKRGGMHDTFDPNQQVKRVFLHRSNLDPFAEVFDFGRCKTNPLTVSATYFSLLAQMQVFLCFIT